MENNRVAHHSALHILIDIAQNAKNTSPQDKGNILHPSRRKPVTLFAPLEIIVELVKVSLLLTPQIDLIQ